MLWLANFSDSQKSHMLYYRVQRRIKNPVKQLWWSFFAKIATVLQYSEALFALEASGLGMISSMWLDGGKDIQSVKSSWSIFVFRA